VSLASRPVFFAWIADPHFLHGLPARPYTQRDAPGSRLSRVRLPRDGVTFPRLVVFARNNCRPTPRIRFKSPLEISAAGVKG
jgi:hypothetical protein